MSDQLHLPHRPPPPEFPAFPLLGVLAPLVVAVVLFVVTRTPELLVFALFTPVLAVAAVLDGRRGTRRRRRIGESAYTAQLAAVEQHLGERTEQRSAAARRAHPRAARLAERAAEWSTHPPAARLLLGHADLAGEPLVSGSVEPGDARERMVLERGRVAVGAPLTVPAASTVTLSGEPVLVAAASRALAVHRARAGGRLVAPIVREGADVVIRLDGPRSARVIGAAASVTHLDGLRFVPDLLSLADFRAVEAVVAGATGAIPLDRLLDEPAAAGELSARFLVDGDESVVLDLVEHGPHAVVGGTTGSGKSALLSAWVLALAAAHPVSAVTILLIDCKGGAAFDRLAELPHVVGVVTDIDGDDAERAVRSLAAEVRRRERVLRDARAADVTGTALPRLVIVVDEFRVLLERWPDLTSVFVDVAARGRSLGVHLVLCTQRPAGSMHHELLTNCGLRIALRVHDAADSTALVGSDAAARLPAAPGGVVVALPGESPRRCRVAAIDGLALGALIERVGASSGADRVQPAAPWLPPLPALIAEADLPEPSVPRAIVFGLLDLPDEQRQAPAEWLPRSGSGLLVFGGVRSGRTNLLAVIAGRLPDAVPLGVDVATAWDRLQDDAVPLVIDELPHLLGALGERHAHSALDRLAVRLRSPSAAPTVLALPGPSAWAGLPLRQLVGLFDDVVLLGLSLEDHLTCGGSRGGRRAAARAGAGEFRGVQLQVAVASRGIQDAPQGPSPALPLDTGRWVLVTDTPTGRTAELAASGVRIVDLDEPVSGVTVVTPEQVQRSWASFQRVRPEAGLLLDGVGHIDARALTGRNDLLPPVGHRRDVVFVPIEGRPERRRLPAVDSV